MEQGPVRPPIPANDITTAVDHAIAGRFHLLLLDHFAQVLQLDSFEYDAKLPTGRTERRIASHVRIRFPPGTLRYNGMMWASSYEFRLVFPDGFELRGIQQVGMSGGDKTILFLPS
jgi:hypothetical protein